MIRKIYQSIVCPIMRVFFTPFYNPKYLRGRWFLNSLQGWIWAFHGIYWQKIMRKNSHVPWPTSPAIIISQNAENIRFHPDDLNNFQSIGNYYQCFASTIKIGKGTLIGPNVGLITSNHDLRNITKHVDGEKIVIGKKCWIGMNAVILPGVELKDNTVVGANAVVTKPFKESNIVIAGNPAKIIKKI